MRLITKIIAGAFVLGSAICINPALASADGLDTEFASAGVSVALEDYCEASTAEVPEAEINNIIDEAVKAVKKENSIFKDICIAKVEEDGYVNVRKRASTEAKVVGKIYGNCGGRIVKEKDGWYKIKSGNCKGWVKAEYFVAGEKAKKYAVKNGYVLATVNESGLRVRKKQSAESKIMSNIYLNETYAVTKYGKEDQWIKLAIEEGVEGWVSADYIDLSLGYDTAITLAEEKAIIEAQKEAERRAAEEASIEASIAASREADSIAASIAAQNTTSAYNYNEWTTQATSQWTTQYYEEPSYNSGTGSDVCSYAKRFLGNPYVWGGSSLTQGADCSGFTMSVFAHYGVYLPHSSSAQRGCGSAVSLSDVKPGDLICYSGHVAIYIGGGQIIHASTPTSGIIISNMYMQTPICARRVIN